MSLYKLENFTKSFGSKTILDVESLEIEEGLIYALLGPNGSGKTTLLNLLGFLDSPTSGSMTFRGNPVVFQESHLHKLRRNVVMVNQNPILFTTTVYKNLEFGLKVRKIEKKQRQKIIEECLDLVGLSSFIQAPAHKLSGGETQRVALARALALSPRIILCDEPTASVDLENQIAISRLLKEINTTKGITLVFTSHDKRQAAFLPHRRLYMEQGKLTRHSYENMFPAFCERVDDKTCKCSIDSVLSTRISSVKEGPCRVQIDPLLIKVGKDIENTPSEELQKGKILRVGKDGDLVRIVIDCGFRLSLKLEPNVYQELKPLVDDDLIFHIPADAVTVIEQ